ncbi:hypothetical protein MSAN_01568900 [Mycena sanguinolenta]|uniref:C2H2-type domain-containing protein n=1 Tax=Mycena sanguinolenta TaxID=230812 RepID=A0A8H6Y2U3_9AGAR|nr:hypothetical protein MSAN_01568900 [Mycena sanguinolenta]
MDSNTSVSESAPKDAVLYHPTDLQPTSMSSCSIHGITHEHQSLEPYQSVPVSYSYPRQSAERTRMGMHHDQFPQIHRESSIRQREGSYTLPSALFSSPPIPSDRPPPSLRLPNPSFPSLDSTRSSSSSRVPVSYRGLSLSLSDSEDDGSRSSPRRKGFITIVPKPVESSTSFSAGNGSYNQSSGISTPNSASEVGGSPPTSIGTIPYVEPREWGRRKSAEKMHRCEICGKEFPRPSAVKTHMNVHSNTRPFPCGFPDCPKTFSVRSNARRHYRTHSEKALPPTSPLPSQSGFQFAELIAQEPLPPPLPPNQSSFRVRWVANNTTTRPRLAPPTKRSDKRATASGVADNGEEQPPVLLYDPW